MDDESQRLYNNYLQFKRSISSRSFPKYSESDLLEIYDVAADNFDYYVQTEVLMIAARLFPESEEFTQRRGFLYNRMFPSVLHDFLDDNGDSEGLCWDILRLRDSGIEEFEAIPLLEKMVSRYDELSDEDIIRLAEVVRDIHCEKWLMDNYKLLLDKASYADTVLYETASLAHDFGADDVAVKLLDELTSIDAFRAENWILLAECYQSLENPEEGLKSLEYAKAISPDNLEIDFLESVLLIDMQKDLDRALNLQFKYLESNPGSTAAIHNISLAYQLSGRTEEAIAFLQGKLRENPSDALIVQDLLAVDPENAPATINIYRSSGCNTDEIDRFINDSVQSFYISGRYGDVVEIVDKLVGTFPDISVANYYLWSLLIIGDYERLYELYDFFRDRHVTIYLDDPEVMLVICMAMINSERFDEAAKVARRVLKLIDNDDMRNNLSYRINMYGCENALNDIISLAELRDMDAIRRFDPLKIKNLSSTSRRD